MFGDTGSEVTLLPSSHFSLPKEEGEATQLKGVKIPPALVQHLLELQLTSALLRASAHRSHVHSPHFHCVAFTVLPDGTDHFLDKNLNQDVDPGSTQEPDSLNNLTGVSPNESSFGLDQNLNLTLDNRSAPGALPLLQPVRPPSLSVHSPLNKPDPSEVDDEAPLTTDSSPDSNLITSYGPCVDPDLLNGNLTSDTVLPNTKLTSETSEIIT